MISYTVDVMTEGSGTWRTIGLRFASLVEADAYMKRMQRHHRRTRTRVAVVEEPVNYRWDGILGDAVALEDGAEWKR